MRSKLGNLYWAKGDLARSRAYSEQALEILRETGNQFHEGITLGNLGTLYQREGEFSLAKQAYEAASELHRCLGNRFGYCITLVYLGNLALEMKELDSGRQQLREALMIARALKSPALKERAYLGLGDLERIAQRYDDALDYFDEAETLIRSLENQVSLGVFLCKRGLLTAAIGKDPTLYLEQAQEIAAQIKAESGSRLGVALTELQEGIRQSRQG